MDRKARYIAAVLDRTREMIGDRLVSLAIFGSQARGDARADSDLDMFIVVEDQGEPVRVLRRRFDDEVEEPLFDERLALLRDGINLDLSPLIFTRTGATSFNPLYLDMVSEAVLVVDSGRFLASRLDRVREQMSRWGSIKRAVGGTWSWDIKPDLKWGETLDYDQ